MKTRILKLSLIFLFLFSITGAGCKKDKIEYADESIKISSYPGITIYKTDRDYIDYVDVQVTDDGRLNAIPAYTKDDPRIYVDAKGNARQNFRFRLKSGYILDNNSSLKDVFTNISFREYVDYNTNHGIAGWPDSLIIPRIIDKNPFTEFYYLNGINKTPKTFTIGEINEMIEADSLKTVFTKLK